LETIKDALRLVVELAKLCFWVFAFVVLLRIWVFVALGR